MASLTNPSNLGLLLHHQPPPSDSLDSFFLSPSSSFIGSRSMVSFEDVKRGKGCNRSFFSAYAHDENGDEDLDEYLHQPEKKRRLTVDQVQFLEKSFEVENKLEPERKVQLAKEVGLQPRQVAIWFQNRRARWKTKQLEKDFDSLQASYDSLKADYDHLLKEKDKLKAEVANLTEKVLLREKQEGNFKQEDENKSKVEEAEQEEQKPLMLDTCSDGEGSKVSVGICSAKSDIFDADSPHYTDGVHSALFEHDQSDLSHDEEDELGKNLFPPPYIFPKLEHVDYSDPSESSCSFGFSAEDHDAFWSWSY